MVLYRIENEEGEGVYQYEPSRWRAADAYDSARQPMPDSSLLSQTCNCPHGGDVRWHDCRLFAFPNTQALRRWFPAPVRRDLREVPEVKVSVYEAPPEYVRADGYQATFMRCQAQLVRREEIPS